jgi:uncharacterized protein (TIGR03086 family)
VVKPPDARSAPVLDNRRVPNHAGSDPTLQETLSLLIRQGRDREAAQLAVAHIVSPTDTNPGVAMDPISQLDVILPLLKSLVASLDDAELTAQTPCENFDVNGVLEHMVGGATAFAAAYRGEAAPTPGPVADLRAAFPVALSDLEAAIKAPGALDRTVAAPFGEVPGDVFARFIALDGLVHGWDIATATGRDYDPPAPVVAAVEGFAQQAIADDMRDGDTFAAAVTPPADATPLTRVVAFTGRQVV